MFTDCGHVTVGPGRSTASYARDPAVVPVLPAPAHGLQWPARGSVLPVIEVLELCPPQAVMISAYGSRIVGQVGGHVSTADLAVDT